MSDTIKPMKRKTRSRQKNLKKDNRSAELKAEKFGAATATVDDDPDGDAPAGNGKTRVVDGKLAGTRMNRDKCYNCGKFGHWGKDCPNPKVKSTNNRKKRAKT